MAAGKALITEERRIGLIGQFASGKTALLTSLINHLQFHSPHRFRLDDNGKAAAAQVVGFHEYGPGNGWKPRPGWEYFNYPAYHQGLTTGTFPPKTGKPEEFVCTFRRTDRWRNKRLRLKFYDVPGERLADAAMVEKPFADWSDHMLAQLVKDPLHRQCSQAFRELDQRTDAAEADWIREYKLTLAMLISQHQPYVTPSTFLLSPEGQQAEPGSAEQMAASCVAGRPDAEFAPLSATVRGANPALAKSFQTRYEEYRREIVRPVFTTLSQCHGLVVLVDVLTVLAGGPGMLDDNLAMLSNLLDVLRPGDGLLRKLQRLGGRLLPAGWGPGGITRIAFVAPMADRVPDPNDRDNMQGLLKDMLERKAMEFTGLRTHFETCSAVRSTQVVDLENRELAGWLADRPVRAEAGSPPRDKDKYAVPSTVPDAWPVQWAPQEYAFPFVHPDMPAARFHPPHQVNLDGILRFLIS